MMAFDGHSAATFIKWFIRCPQLCVEFSYGREEKEKDIRLYVVLSKRTVPILRIPVLREIAGHDLRCS